MRHRKKGRKLNRTASHRKALLRNLANQIIEHKEIKTTTAKAKEARSTVERMITYAKKGDLHHRRLAFNFLRNKESVNILFDEIAPAFAEREGGYTRVLKLGRRQGDSAPISILQLVGFEKLEDTSKPEKKRQPKKKEPATAGAAATTEAAAEAPVEEVEEVPEVQEAEVVEEVAPEEPKKADVEKAEEPEPPEETKAEAPAEEAASEPEPAEEEKDDEPPADEEKKK